MAAPESWIVVGEPYWQHEPEREYLEAIGVTRNDFGTHYQNVEVGRSTDGGGLHTRKQPG